jgi:hypothetical protein
MRLDELSPVFLKIEDSKHYREIDTITGADGVIFLCPVCFTKNGGPTGTHKIICWQPHVPLSPDMVGPGRWAFTGTGYPDLSLPSSVALPHCAADCKVPCMAHCKAHFLMQNGQITIC